MWDEREKDINRHNHTHKQNESERASEREIACVMIGSMHVVL